MSRCCSDSPIASARCCRRVANDVDRRLRDLCVLVAIGHRGVLPSGCERAKPRRCARAPSSPRRRHARAKLQAIPPVLLQSLDGIAETVRRDPQLTERQLTRLADYLRLALECTDERGMTPERERALECRGRRAARQRRLFTRTHPECLTC